MIDAAIIEQDPSWLPHHVDVATRQVEFIRVERAELAEAGFLADRDPEGQARKHLPWDAVTQMKPPPGQLHFLFHSAFCRSTLLVRAADTPGVVAGLNEPAILSSLSNAGEAMGTLIGPLLSLLARPWDEGKAVIVKPTNHANMLLPHILRARPEARAVLMSNALPVFLRSVARRGLLGRNWARKLFLEVQSYAGIDFGMSSQESFALTDLQTAGLAWFLNQRYFTLLSQGKSQGIATERLKILDGDRFSEQREDTFAALFAHCGIDADDSLPKSLAIGSVFSQHSKLGGEYSDDNDALEDPLLTAEIDQVGEWVSIIAQQAGIAVPAEQTLF